MIDINDLRNHILSTKIIDTDNLQIYFQDGNTEFFLNTINNAFIFNVNLNITFLDTDTNIKKKTKVLIDWFSKQETFNNEKANLEFKIDIKDNEKVDVLFTIALKEVNSHEAI